MREADSRISRLNQEAQELRTRMNPNDVVNTTLLPGQSAVQNNFGINRQIQDAQNNFGDQLQILEGEKISLMKRLNMVLSELEKATHEKSDISQKIREQDAMAEDLRMKLSEVQSLKNVVNRNLQDDLKFERDLNAKLREELDRFEREKETLIGKLNEEEELSGQIQRETDSVNTNLLRKTDDLRRLEDEHDHTQQRLRQLNEQLDNLRNVEVKNRHQKAAMDNELQDLTNQRNDLIRRMNELSEKYDGYVSQMNRERYEITERNKQHVKMLVAKLLAQIINENLHKKRKRAFQEISATASQMANLQSKLSRLHRILCNYSEDRSRFFLRLWYRKAFNVVHENYKRNSLIDANVDHMRRQKFFYLWRTLYNKRKRVFGNKVAAVKVISRLTCGQQDTKLRHYLCRWRDHTERRQAQDEFLLSICHRRRQRTYRKAFVTWLSFQKREELLQKYEILNDIVTKTIFKQKCFLALKHACMQQKAENCQLKFVAWKNWCETARKNKFFQKKELMVEKLYGMKVERSLKQVFDAIRFHNIQEKFETARSELEQRIPEREELENKKERMIKTSATKQKKQLFKNCYYRYMDVKHKAFLVWRDYNNYYNNVMNRLKLKLIAEHKRRLLCAFMRWKEGADQIFHLELMEMNETQQNENQDLVNELNKKNDVREQQKVQSGRQQQTKLERILNFVDRKRIRAFFKRWVAGAKKLDDLETALFKSSKTAYKNKLRNNFNKWKVQAKAKLRAATIENRCQWLISVREKATIKDLWNQFKQYCKEQNMARRFLLRAVNGMDRNSKSDAMAKWKKAEATRVQMIYEENIAELEKRQEEQGMEIKRKRKEIENDQSSKQRIVAKMKSLSQKVMANFITRSTYMQEAKGFYTWLDAVKQFNSKKRQMSAVLNHMHRAALSQAFKTWSDKSYAIREAQLKRELAIKEQEKRKLIEEQKKNNFEQVEMIEDLDNAIEQATNKKEQIEKNFENAFNTWTSRKQRNIYVPKQENIFKAWRSYVQKEKNAVNVIGAIVRRRLRCEVFERIRLVGRERHLDSRAALVCTRFFNLVKHGSLVKAFSRWRENSKQSVLYELQMIEHYKEESQQQQGLQLEKIKERRANIAAETIRRSNLRKVKTVMDQMLKFLRALRIKKQVLKDNVNFLRSKRATQLWFQRTQVTLYLRRRNAQVLKDYKLKKMRIVWKGWKENLRQETLGAKMMSRLLSRMQFFDQAKAFQHWQQMTIGLRQREKENKKFGADGINNLLKRLLKKRMALYLHSLRNRTEKRDFKEKCLQRMLRHVASYRYRHYFDKWKHCSNLMAIADTVNTEGQVVMTRNELQRKAKAMVEQLQKMGYAPDVIQRFLDENSEKQRQMMQRGIRTIFYKHSEFEILPKAFNQLKAFVQARKLARMNARRVLNWMRHPLAIAFKKWKYDLADAQKKLEGLSKQDLIDKIIQDEQLLGSKKSKLDRMDYTIDNLAIQREQLLGHFIRGQKLALALCNSNYKRSIGRAFLRWKQSHIEQEAMQLVEQLERTNQMIGDLGLHVSKLEQINQSLLRENEELRSAALDGIEIAKVVQELTREREALSTDLQDRAGTIKKLIEDNNNLSVRLNIAQREAHQLELMKQQVYMEPPQREPPSHPHQREQREQCHY